MGCGPSSPAGSEGGGGGSKPTKGAKGNKVVEELFGGCGEEKTLADGEVLIEQGSTKDSAFYIKSGSVKLLLKGEDGSTQQLATRGVGDMLGELSLLLGHPATVTAVADGAVTAIEVHQGDLMAKLRSEPASSGRLFKWMAVALAERISELSSKLRSNVSTSAAVPAQKAQQLPAADIAKARGMFALKADEKLVGFYQCSVRAERNAVKDEHAHVGEMYVFEKHVCFDLKVTIVTLSLSWRLTVYLFSCLASCFPSHHTSIFFLFFCAGLRLPQAADHRVKGHPGPPQIG